jgi:NTP pyrophosphatase (non-canonical NTP hydrolase)
MRDPANGVNKGLGNPYAMRPERPARIRRTGAEEAGRSWTNEEVALGFAGDVGDLAKLVTALEGFCSIPDARQQVAHGLADCLWSVVVLSHLHDIDLEQAFLLTMDQPEQHIVLEGRMDRMEYKEFVQQWVENLMAGMDAHLDEEARVELMEACGRACSHWPCPRGKALPGEPGAVADHVGSIKRGSQRCRFMIQLRAEELA